VRWIATISALALTAAMPAEAREVQALADGWSFDFGIADELPARPGFDDSDWAKVAVPHTWNRLGNPGTARDATINADRGMGWYRRTLCAPAAGKRSFLEFDAASIVADVWLNGVRLGRHEGAFSRFRLDASAAMRPGCDNVLAVRTDNSKPDPGSATWHVVPLSGDFMMFGGLYRPVTQIAVDPVHIDLMDHGGPGVYGHVAALDAAGAEVAVRTRLANDGAKAAEARLRVTILDADGKVVARSDRKVPIAADAVASDETRLRVADPHRWNGLADPYLYRILAEVRDAKGRLIDRVEQPLGIRTIAIDADKGFFLNGKPLKLHGVSRHQDRYARGWALTKADHEQDMALIRDLGANTVRLSHYNQATPFYDLADSTGMILWAELGLVNQTAPKGVKDTPPEMRANAEMQMIELIRQNYNHPSVAMWSIGNEVTNWSWKGLTPSNPRPLMEALNALAKREDPTRPTTMATCCEPLPGEDDDRPILTGIADTVGFNRYIGWYGKGYVDEVEDLAAHLTELHRKFPGLPVSLGEYGGGGALSQHTDNVHGGKVMNVSRPQPEEIESYIHERSWAQIKGLEWLYGAWVWQMFDAASEVREEGDTTDVNTKGLVSFDRKVKKDAYYFYQAAWRTDVPVLHLTGKRYTDRAYRSVDVRAYSNQPRARLSVNGRDIGWTNCIDAVCVWKSVRLDAGANNLVAEAGLVRDSAEWRYDGGANDVHIRSGTLTGAVVGGVRYGSDNYFDGGKGAPLNRFRREIYAAPGSEEQDPHLQVTGTDQPALYENYRSGIAAYRVPVANGRYRVTLHLFEPAEDAAGKRVFDVAVSGGAARRGVDPFALGKGKLKAATIVLPARVSDGILTIDFTKRVGEPIVSAVDIVAE